MSFLKMPSANSIAHCLNLLSVGLVLLFIIHHLNIDCREHDLYNDLDHHPPKTSSFSNTHSNRIISRPIPNNSWSAILKFRVNLLSEENSSSELFIACLVKWNIFIHLLNCHTLENIYFLTTNRLSKF